MKHYVAEIKEVMNDTILRPVLWCDEKTPEELIKHWGLKEPDIEWFRVYEEDENGNKKLIL